MNVLILLGCGSGLMRVTAEQKQATRRRVLEAALSLFRKRGFDATTTRDIAQAAGIATGTVFNYFATKEAIVECAAAEALAEARSRFARQAVDGRLDEAIFALIAAELRQLKPLRTLISSLLETSLSPLAAPRRAGAGESLRAGHLEIAAGLARRHGFGDLTPLAWQLYWTLYTGVLAYWAADHSPQQEDTLALLDQSLAMFVAWLASQRATP